MKIVIIIGSHRRGGNTANTASLLEEYIRKQAFGKRTKVADHTEASVCTKTDVTGRINTSEATAGPEPDEVDTKTASSADMYAGISETE